MVKPFEDATIPGQLPTPLLKSMAKTDFIPFGPLPWKLANWREQAA